MNYFPFLIWVPPPFHHPLLLFFNTEVECEETLYFAGAQYFDLIARFLPVDFKIGLNIVSSGKVVFEDESFFSAKGLGKKCKINLIGLDKMLKIVLVCLLIDDQGWTLGSDVEDEKMKKPNDVGETNVGCNDRGDRCWRES